MLDLLVTGECFYKVTIPKIGETPDIEVEEDLGGPPPAPPTTPPAPPAKPVA